ncbi:hypothetical protein ABEB36_003153 [Hypothenemus hampei]|uniref:Transmembrane protein 50A n=1 Tax=Hypothenemus hampei TaxID=57062 RepID=A0ABD1F892_HYPHA
MYNVSSLRFHLNALQINLLISAISSLLFFTGWWVIADVDVYRIILKNKTYYVPGIISTFAFLFTNIVPAHYFYDSFTYRHGCFTPAVARTYLLMWLMISFGCLIGSFYILINDFILDQDKQQWPGYGICLQNCFIFTANMLLRFGKKHDPFY